MAAGLGGHPWIVRWTGITFSTLPPAGIAGIEQSITGTAVSNHDDQFGSGTPQWAVIGCLGQIPKASATACTPAWWRDS